MTSPVERAQALGHQVEDDAPGGVSRVQRWTCTVCGDAVLSYNGNIYGGAVERTCEESQAFWATRDTRKDGRGDLG